MLNVPENLSGAVNRQTVLTINTKKVVNYPRPYLPPGE